MKWTKMLKYPMQAIVILAPLFVLLAMATVMFFVTFPINFILLFIFGMLISKDDIPFWYGWKKEERQKFSKNWDAMCDGKVHEEIRDGERWAIIDSEE